MSFTFINLKKAYDFVPRKAMSLALDKLGVTDEIFSLVHSFYEGMKAEITCCHFYYMNSSTTNKRCFPLISSQPFLDNQNGFPIKNIPPTKSNN